MKHALRKYSLFLLIALLSSLFIGCPNPSSGGGGGSTFHINTPFEGDLSTGETQSYQFQAEVGMAYTISWLDSWNSDDGYTCDIVVILESSDGSEIGESDDGPIYFLPESSGTYTLKIEGYDGTESGTFQLLLTEETYTPVEPITEPAKKESWTVMYYSDADNDLEQYLMEDIQEIMDGLQRDADINVILLVDRIPGYTSEFSTLGEDFTDTRLYRLVPNNFVRIGGGTQMPSITTSSNVELNMGDGDTLKSFIEFCKANYPADNYALMMSNHGGGARSATRSAVAGQTNVVKDICFDETSNNDALYTAELTDVLTGDEAVDLLVFDACLMATVEVAYQLRSGNGDFHADYLLASAPTVWGFGLEYTSAFQRLTAASGDNGTADTTLGGQEANYDPATLTAQQMAAVFLEEQRDSVNAAGATEESFTLIDTSQIGAVKTAVDTLAQSLASDNEKTDMETLRGSLAATKVIDYFIESDEMEWIYIPYFDLYDFADSISGSSLFSATIQNQASAVATAVDNAVVYSFGGSEYSSDNMNTFSEGQCGLSIFLPDGDRVDSVYGNDMWAYQWWYNAIDTTTIDADWLYGKLDWCIDGGTGGNDTVENWFEMLDSFFDTSNDSATDLNGYAW